MATRRQRGSLGSIIFTAATDAAAATATAAAATAAADDDEYITAVSTVQ